MKNPYTALIDKLNQLQGPELQTAANLLDQLIARREPETVEISKEDLQAIHDQRKAIGDIKGSITANLSLTINFTGELPFSADDQVISDVGYTVKGKTKLEKEIAKLIILDDWDLLNALQDLYTEVPEIKNYAKKIEELETQIEKLAQKYGLAVHEVEEQIVQYGSSSQKKPKFLKQKRRVR